MNEYRVYFYHIDSEGSRTERFIQTSAENYSGAVSETLEFLTLRNSGKNWKVARVFQYNSMRDRWIRVRF